MKIRNLSKDPTGKTWLLQKGLQSAGFDIDDDNDLGPKTERALTIFQTSLESDSHIRSVEIPVDQELDQRTLVNIKTLHPRLQSLATDFMKVIRKNLGDFRITSGLRTYEEQDALYAKGRTEPGSIVTHAKGGFSNHNFGVAFDITLFNGTQPVWESPLYATAGLIGEKMGLDWAGGGIGQNFHDEPHYEMPGATANLANMRARKAMGLDVLG